jgi:hypothetical protein
MQIKCPACQNDISIPQAQAAAPPAPKPQMRINVPTAHSAAPPPPPPPPAPPLPRPGGLGVARPTPPPPPQAEVAAAAPSPPTHGENRVLQWSGLLGAFLVTAIIIGMAATWKPPETTHGKMRFVREKRGRKYVTVVKYDDAEPRGKTGAASDEDGDDDEPPTPTAPAQARSTLEWTLDLKAASIPDAPANGQIAGGAFTADKAYLQRTPTGHLFILRQGAGYQAQRELMMVLTLKPGEKLEGNSWSVDKDTTAGVPRITKRWMQNARQQTRIFTNGYAMKLEFAQPENNEVPTKLFVALPDEEKSYVGGTVRATYLVAGAGAQQRPRQ